MDSQRERRSIEVTGVVQGVGFRPFVYGIASRLGLGGSVCNRAGAVRIEVEGPISALDRFVAELRSPPSLARVETVRIAGAPPTGEEEFRIVASEAGTGAAVIPPDTAVCDECVGELFDPNDRRHLHPFITCTNCGPRLTIVERMPYDRERTTMAEFPLCDRCRAEYEDPRDRRHHAQPLCCPQCGPSLRIAFADGERVVGPETAEEPIAFAARSLRAGRIAAIKGIGGYHLACDARSDAAVAELRRRKARDQKPLAVMVRDLGQAERLCALSAEERALLSSAARPIVLCRKRKGAALAEAVAPGGNPLLGLLLPYTPVHHLLLRAFEGALVMTSGNLSDEPIAFDDADALLRLRGIADFFLLHDRRIRTRCDDSVLRVVDGIPSPIRRARGYAPLPIALPHALARPAIALGGQLKSTFALGDGARAFVSQHLGDLDHYAAFAAYREAVASYPDLCRIEPREAVHDLHPDYASTRFARELGVPCFGVQHHHAHFASCLAEHGERGAAIGVCFDGTGYGADGTIWGGEFLAGSIGSSVRAAHLLPVPMPGGEAAIREPWRMAVAHLRAAGESLEFPDAPREGPLTSSMGRLFDAISAIASAHRGRIAFEAQAALALEWLAADAALEAAYPFDLLDRPGALCIDTRPLVAAAARDARAAVPARTISSRFHAAVVSLVAETCVRLRERTGIAVAALSGGVFANAVISSGCAAALGRRGFRVLRHKLVPPNDGGLCVGQLAAAAAREQE